MAFSRFQAGIFLRVGTLAITLVAVAWMITDTQWYVTIALLVSAALVQVAMLTHFATQSSRETARFLDAVSFDDASQTFSRLRGDNTFRELSVAMTRVLDRLRKGRAEREEQTQYLQTLIAHVPVALVAVDEFGSVQLLNIAARRLFEGACVDVSQFSRFGDAFATGIEYLKPGDGVILRMERSSGTLQLKVAGTDFALGGTRRRLISLQNIETELTAQELVAWQTVIRVMAHEVMNSLTPVSSLAATAQELVNDVLDKLPPDDSRKPALADASDALETMVRRSEGLLHFVQNHRRLTKRIVARTEIVPIQRIFVRLQRLLAKELASRNIKLSYSVEPPTLEIAVDAELLDQALINLVRNAIEALRDEHGGQITLFACRDQDGHAVIAVADNGPGIAAEQREKVFVPFFTTKKQGSGVGLTLVRQIATVHGATVGLSETRGGGATVTLRF
jgi:nitrogen fixation/metabolism regulation signal transduction histidine kinase